MNDPSSTVLIQSMNNPSDSMNDPSYSNSKASILRKLEVYLVNRNLRKIDYLQTYKDLDVEVLCSVLSTKIDALQFKEEGWRICFKFFNSENFDVMVYKKIWFTIKTLFIQNSFEFELICFNGWEEDLNFSMNFPKNEIKITHNNVHNIYSLLYLTVGAAR